GAAAILHEVGLGLRTAGIMPDARDEGDAGAVDTHPHELRHHLSHSSPSRSSVCRWIGGTPHNCSSARTSLLFSSFNRRWPSPLYWNGCPRTASSAACGSRGLCELLVRNRSASAAVR